MSADLSALFTELARVYQNEPTLLTARDSSGAWYVIVDDRPSQKPTVVAFPTDAERDAWLGRVYASALTIPEEDELGELARYLSSGSQEGRNENLDEGGPSAGVRVPVPPPTKPGGGERAFDDALAEPRSP